MHRKIPPLLLEIYINPIEKVNFNLRGAFMIIQENTSLIRETRYLKKWILFKGRGGYNIKNVAENV